jgi:hypothetical protein
MMKAHVAFHWGSNCHPKDRYSKPSLIRIAKITLRNKKIEIKGKFNNVVIADENK